MAKLRMLLHGMRLVSVILDRKDFTSISNRLEIGRKNYPANVTERKPTCKYGVICHLCPEKNSFREQPKFDTNPLRAETTTEAAGSQSPEACKDTNSPILKSESLRLSSPENSTLSAKNMTWHTTSLKLEMQPKAKE